MKFWITSLLLFIVLLAPARVSAEYHVVSELSELPFKEVNDIEYDSDGLLWLATRNGLFSYDSYRLRSYRNDQHHISLLSDNYVRRVVEDQQKRIWIATTIGLDRLDKHTEQIEHMHSDQIDVGTIADMITTSNGDVWVACSSGFARFCRGTDQAEVISLPIAAGRKPKAQTMMEDHRGDIWLGTWDNGLFRFCPQTHKIFVYPQLNQQNSAHVILEDKNNRIWVAGWGSGITVISDAWIPDEITYKTISAPALLSNFTYCLTLDEDNHQVLAGSSHGITLIDTEDLTQVRQLRQTPDSTPIPGEEVTGIIKNPHGQFWVSMIGRGLATIDNEGSLFEQNMLKSIHERMNTASVRRIYADQDDYLWMSIGTQGMAVHDLQTGKEYLWSDIPALRSAMDRMITVNGITQTYDHHIWFITHGSDIIELILPQGSRDLRLCKCNIYPPNSGFVPSRDLFCIKEDKNDNLWFGGHLGASMRHPDGSYTRFDTLTIDVGLSMADLEIRDMSFDLDGDIWIAAREAGIVHLRKTSDGTWKASNYSMDKGTIGDNKIEVVCCDYQGNVWAGAGSGMLYRLDVQRQLFIPMNELLRLPGEFISFIKTSPDNEAELWVGTNEGLLCIDQINHEYRVQHYTQEDGLIDNFLIKGSTSFDQHGRLYIGTHKGYNTLDIQKLRNKNSELCSARLSDLKINGISWSALSKDERQNISDLAPAFTDHLTIRNFQKELTFEFSPHGTKGNRIVSYAYRLEGYDNDWRITSSRTPFAIYSNLGPGDYRLLAYAIPNTQLLLGELDNDKLLSVQITVLPPWWKTKWMIVIFNLLFVVIVLLLRKAFIHLQYRWRRILVLAREKSAQRKGNIVLTPQKPSITSADADFLRRVEQCMNRHLSESQFDQQQFLEEMGVSKTTCFRRLKTLTGMNYSNFVRNFKINAALKLLNEQPDIRISDLAYSVGFNDPKYFSSCFKKQVGKLPSEMQTELIEKKGER